MSVQIMKDLLIGQHKYLQKPKKAWIFLFDYERLFLISQSTYLQKGLGLGFFYRLRLKLGKNTCFQMF